MKAVIPIAGKGTRFLPATKQIPKELIPILNFPMLHYVVSEVVASGIHQIIFVTSSGKEGIEDFYDRNFELEMFLEAKGKTEELKLVKELGSMVDVVTVRQKEPLGLGHAILCVKNLIEKDENFVVLLGDDLTLSNDVPVMKQLLNVSQKYDSAPVVGVMEVPITETKDYGIIEGVSIAQGIYKISSMVEKPSSEKTPSNLAVLGRYILPFQIFDFLEKIPLGVGREFQLTDAINGLCQNRDVLAYSFAGERYDTGSMKGYLNATLEFALRNDKLNKYALDLMREKIKRYE